jgi:hypothetical protein
MVFSIAMMRIEDNSYKNADCDASNDRWERASADISSDATSGSKGAKDICGGFADLEKLVVNLL